jgi:recombination protein RecA
MSKKKVIDEEQESESKQSNNIDIINEICATVADAQILDPDTTEFISTGNLALDFIFSGRFWGGGLPLGRITEVYGPSSTGKTVIGTHTLQGVQKAGGFAILIDSEHAYDANFAKNLGINIEELIHSEAESLQDCYKSMVKMIQLIRSKTDKPVFIVYDSIAASPSIKEKTAIEEGKDAPAEMGERARINSQYLRNIASMLKKQKIGVIIINQIRSKIGVIFGSNETVAGGGKSLEFYCSIRADCRKRGSILDERKKPIGIKMDVKCTKNKISSPFREAKGLELYFNKGISPISGLIELLEEERRVNKSGAWYSIEGSDKKFQSKNFVEILLENPELIGAPNRESVEEYIGRNRVSLEEAENNENVIIEGIEGEEE